MDDYLITIPDSNIHFEFIMDAKHYALISDKPEMNEGDTGYFAQIITMDDGTKVARHIESDEQYKKVEKKFNRLMNKLGDE